ncbi:MAG TPA: hypothetical protein VFF29_02760 [Bacteroidota bacterium]|nr:hypothetical protein [Bacteroidota bacterium]
MIEASFIQRGNPDLLGLYGLILSILLALWLLNRLYEWLKQKPWKKPETAFCDEEIQVEKPQDEKLSKDLMEGVKLLPLLTIFFMTVV